METLFPPPKNEEGLGAHFGLDKEVPEKKIDPPQVAVPIPKPEPPIKAYSTSPYNNFLIGLEQQAEEECIGMMGQAPTSVPEEKKGGGGKTTKKKGASGSGPKTSQGSSKKEAGLTKANSMIGAQQ